MKKVISSLFVGVLGGAFSLVGNYYFNQNNSNQSLNYNPYSPPAQLTSYSGLTANAPDFVTSAEKSVNSVVHIKTIVEGNQNLSYDPFQEWFFGGKQRQP